MHLKNPPSTKVESGYCPAGGLALLPTKEEEEKEHNSNDCRGPPPSAHYGEEHINPFRIEGSDIP